MDDARHQRLANGLNFHKLQILETKTCKQEWKWKTFQAIEWKKIENNWTGYEERIILLFIYLFNKGFESKNEDVGFESDRFDKNVWSIHLNGRETFS